MSDAERLIDLRSDTVTRPTAEMRRAIAEAEVGDDMVGADPTVNRLEAMVAELLGKEAAVFACSATQANQMAVRTHCRPGDELLIESTGHIANFEAGGPAVLSGVTCKTLRGTNGQLSLGDVDGQIRADDQHLCPTTLVCLENTSNVGGGRVYSLDVARQICDWAHDHGVKTHLDGARLLNAVVAGGYGADEFAAGFDTVTICFSKGLGCPMGAALAGSAADIAAARRSRKIFGGALRQAGIPAAAAVYALEHHIERLADDHANAQHLAQRLAAIEGVEIDPADVETNLVFFNVQPELGSAAQLSTTLKNRGVIVGAVGPQRLRACTHLDLSRQDVDDAADQVAACVEAGFAEVGPATASPYAQR